MGLVVVGAAGRMGQALIRAIASVPGATVAAAIERKGSNEVGRDAGELAGVGSIGVKISDDPLPAFAKADGVLDFSVPAASVEFAGYAARRASCMWSARPAAAPRTTRRSRPPRGTPRS